MQHPLYGCLWVKLMHRCMFVSVCFCRIYLFTFDLHFLFFILPLPPLLACFPDKQTYCCLTEIFRSVLKEMEMLYHCLQCKCQSCDLPLMRQHPCKIENFVLELLAVLKTLICCFECQWRCTQRLHVIFHFSCICMPQNQAYSKHLHRRGGRCNKI